jgi:hypothetical protein
LHDDRRIRIRIHTSDYWIRIRIRKAKTNVDPVDPEEREIYGVRENKSSEKGVQEKRRAKKTLMKGM